MSNQLLDRCFRKGLLSLLSNTGLFVCRNMKQKSRKTVRKPNQQTFPLRRISNVWLPLRVAQIKICAIKSGWQLLLSQKVTRRVFCLYMCYWSSSLSHQTVNSGFNLSSHPVNQQTDYLKQCDCSLKFILFFFHLFLCTGIWAKIAARWQQFNQTIRPR